MIHIFIGTKAQYVKTAPVIRELDKRGIPYNLIDSGQHAALSKNYRDYFGIREPNRLLCKEKEDIKTVSVLMSWITRVVFLIIFRPKKIFNDLFQGQGGVCLIHGDTPTTWLSALACKRVGIKVVHLESGLRSYNLFHPFPEELIRIITMHLSDYLFAPSAWAFKNLALMKVKGQTFLLSGNTNIDALTYIQSRKSALPEFLKTNARFSVFSIHRAETILNKTRLKKILDLIRRISPDYTVLFCLHPPTKQQLKKFHLDHDLANMPGVIVRDLLAYPQFIEAIKNAYFIVTDGGSVQEESYYLNVPCLLMRDRTERKEGIQENVYICEFKQERITYFLNHIDQFRTSSYQSPGRSPSCEIVDILTEEIIPS